MELSHWNLEEIFTIKQAACLACGVDPNLVVLSDDQLRRCNYVYERMREAFEEAEDDVSLFLEHRSEGRETNEKLVFKNGSLPSIGLAERLERYIKTGGEWILTAVDVTSQYFSRSDLDGWLKVKRTPSAYCFELPSLEIQSGNAAILSELDGTKERRAKLDITRERGCRRHILENWEKVLQLHGGGADARQALVILKRNMDKSDRLPTLKTVQNKMAELRKENLIP
jgi:hypothetical protein